ncbi:MAG TPA: tRNA uridine-5-carboxymethylaminomethyl(34) synthesis enzyme MnmG, partial [Algoriphagus sp.]|nr:tRNA uridine-5-carboxymethylaminomethyl(34) synthesis enzyme MnmG [Algoriphagus sp.]
MVEKLSNMENFRIPQRFDYLAIPALSAEGKQKLNKIRPETLGQASRISGVSPADLSILTVYLGR